MWLIINYCVLKALFKLVNINTDKQVLLLTFILLKQEHYEQITTYTNFTSIRIQHLLKSP